MHELPSQTPVYQTKLWNTAIKLVQWKQANVFSGFKLLRKYIQSKNNLYQVCCVYLKKQILPSNYLNESYGRYMPY